MRTKALWILALCTLLQADYTKTNDIVTDSSTLLQWQDSSDNQSNTYTWEEALNYCEGLILGGYEDWRVPQKNELMSIVDYTRFNPSLPEVFTAIDLLKREYWTATTYKLESYEHAWTIEFQNGIDGHVRKIEEYAVRCVRSSN